MASSVSLFPVVPSDAEIITRNVDVPASRNGPLFRTMFPTYDNFTSAEKEEMLHWQIDSLQEALKDPKDELFLKACQVDGQGDNTTQPHVPLGFCAWDIIDRTRRPATTDPDTKTETSDQPNEVGLNFSIKTGNTAPRKRVSLPGTLDVDSWIALSDNLRTERQRVLQHLTNVCRLTMMSVNPDFQKQGIGSLMMQRICAETDHSPGRSAYVLAAPEGVKLYSRFGFEIIGEVETPYGKIKSMLRKARS